jgi:hypothetical protein
VKFPQFRHLLLGACFGLPLALAGCGGPPAAPQIFAPLHYSYLAPISLNVGTIVTQVNYVPAMDGSSIDGMSPEAPLDAVRAMIQDRMVAAGSGGTATVQVNDASLRRVGDTVVATVSIHLTVQSADGHRTGYTDASVTRTRTTPDDSSMEAMRAFLYAMVQDLMNAENVQLEYQIRQNLGGWLVGGVSAIGGPAAPVAVQTQDLGSSPVTSVPPVSLPATSSAPTPLVPPPYVSAVTPNAALAPYGAPPMATPASLAPPVAPMNTDTMPGGSVGLPEGNAVQPPPVDSGAPTQLTPSATPGDQLVPASPSGMPAAMPAAAAPAAAAPAAASPSSSSGALPPLPAGITP